MSFDLNSNKNTKLSNFGHDKDSLFQISKETWKAKLPSIEQLIKLQSEALYLGVTAPIEVFFSVKFCCPGIQSEEFRIMTFLFVPLALEEDKSERFSLSNNMPMQRQTGKNRRQTWKEG